MYQVHCTGKGNFMVYVSDVRLQLFQKTGTLVHSLLPIPNDSLINSIHYLSIRCINIFK